MILRSEDLYSDTPAIVGQTLEFLGLPQAGATEYGTVNKGSYREKMDVATREYLLDYFRPHNERLYEYLGRAFGWDR